MHPVVLTPLSPQPMTRGPGHSTDPTWQWNGGRGTGRLAGVVADGEVGVAEVDAEPSSHHGGPAEVVHAGSDDGMRRRVGFQR